MPGIGRGPRLKSLRFDSASVLAQRDDLSSIKEEMALELAELRGEQKGLDEAVVALGGGRTDKVVAVGGLAFAGLGAVALLAGGPVTLLVAAGALGTVGGGGLAALGSVRFWRRTSELERLRRRQRWLRSEVTRYTRAIERVSEAIELRARHAAG